jgi:hypothetical protein
MDINTVLWREDDELTRLREENAELRAKLAELTELEPLAKPDPDRARITALEQMHTAQRGVNDGLLHAWRELHDRIVRLERQIRGQEPLNSR